MNDIHDSISNSENVSLLNGLDPDLNLLEEAVPHDMCKHYSIDNIKNMIDGKDKFSVLNYNIRSFHANGSSFMSALDLEDLNFDCIILSETWNTETNFTLCNIPGYDSFHTYRPLGHVYSTGGGISLFCNTITIKQKILNNDLSICNAHIETCVVDLLFGNKKITIVAIYRPPHGCKQQFTSDLERILNVVCGSGNEVVVLGDINLNMYLLNEPDVHNYASMLYSKSMVQLINKFTRYPNGPNSAINPSILDHIWTCYLNISACGTIDYTSSDHLPVFCTLNLPTTTGNDDKIKIQSRPFSEENLSKFSNEISNINWDAVLDYNDPENSLNIFADKLNSLYSKCFPLKTKFISQKRVKNKWISHEVKLLINKKAETCRKFRNGLITGAENNQVKNQINRQVKKAKNKYFTDQFNAYKTNMKRSWSLLNHLMGKNKSKQQIVSIMDGDTEITESIDIANKFADYFSNIGVNLENNLYQNDSSPTANIDRNPHSFYLFPVTSNECSNVISNLKLTRTHLNQIPVSIFKSVKDIVCVPMMKLINSSFRLGIFPTSLKLARVTPIFKKLDQKLCSNYRPISSLPYLSKIYERLMGKRIVSFFNKHSLFSEKQFGFLKGRSTQEALMNFTENIYDALDACDHNISILIDLKSAFDTVNHSILISKLELYGIRGVPLKWIESYLSDRKFYVSLNGSSSSTKTLNIGIPQGSILGPLYFIIYNNDLPKVSNILSTTLFADDTNFSISNNCYETMKSTLNEELVKINEWTAANGLTINTNKTELLLFSNRHVNATDYDIFIDGDPVAYQNHARFLGVMVDKKLNFKIHIDIVNTKVSKHAGILYKIRNDLSASARKIYYNSFILPYLTYCIIHWGNTNAVHLKPLYLTQKRIIRCLTGAEFLDSTTPLFYKLEILKLNDLYKFYAVLDTFKKLKSGDYEITHNINTRNRHDAKKKFHRTSRTQQSITFSGPSIWNTLPTDIKNIDKFSTLKVKLKEYFLKQYSPAND